MLQEVEGIYRNGKVELLEVPATSEVKRVIVNVFRKPRGIGPEQAANLRSHLQAFTED